MHRLDERLVGLSVSKLDLTINGRDFARTWVVMVSMPHGGYAGCICDNHDPPFGSFFDTITRSHVRKTPEEY